jgi:Zn-dependent membrane protease YugP
MHPILILIPIAGLSFAPRWWADRVLKRHNRSDVCTLGAEELARIWLDRNRLQVVGVEVTDLGDHYDPETRTVRLSRDKHARRTLTAVTTAAHEVAHALQDFDGYAPFSWRNRLAKFAAMAGQAGTVILLSVPAAALLGRRPLPPLLLGASLWVMLGSGMVAQFAALVSELDASFRRALPLVRDVVASEAQLDQARRILLACSLTYAAASLLSVLHFWPWLGPRRLPATLAQAGLVRSGRAGGYRSAAKPQPHRRGPRQHALDSHPRCRRDRHALLRTLGKPVIRVWFRVVRAAGH